jgi:hypothetical protein
VVIADRSAPVVTHMVWYPIGSDDEPAGKAGITHFLEQLLFKGTATLRPGEFSNIVYRQGGEDNAFTTRDYTAYYEQISRDRLAVVMEIEADRMVNLAVTEEDVAIEREVLREERREIENDPLTHRGAPGRDGGRPGRLARAAAQLPGSELYHGRTRRGGSPRGTGATSTKLTAQLPTEGLDADILIGD